MLHRIVRLFCNCAAAALLCAAVHAEAARTTPSHASTADVRMETSTAAGRQALLAEATRKGSIVVVASLKLDSPWIPEARLKAAMPKAGLADPVAAQRAKIAAVQAEVLGLVPKSAGGPATRKYNVPAISLTVTRAELDKLLANPKVAHVAIEKDLDQHLAETTQTISAAASDLAGYSGAGWTIAVIDSGVSATHPFIQGKVIDEACFSMGDTDRESFCPSGTSPQYGAGAGANCNFAIDGCAHGTHVAGIAAGKNGCFAGSSYCGFDGVARDATLMAVQVFHRNRSTNTIKANMADVRSALEYVYAARDRLKIASVNLSLGGGLYDGECDATDPATTQAMENLRAANIAVVISTGNNNVSNAIGLPACLSPAIAVSGSAGDGVWTAEPGFGSNNSTRTDLFAPAAHANGVGVLSAYLSSQGEYRYDYANGTSMAAPHVAGAFAVLRQRDAVAPVAQLLAALAGTGTLIADTRPNGGGVQRPRINLAAALAAVSNAGQESNLYWRDAASGLSLWQMNGAAITTTSTYNVASEWSVIDVADFNGDGFGDLLWHNNAGAMYLWFLGANAPIGFADLGTLGPEWSFAGAADFNGDGRADLLMRRSDGLLYLWHMNGGTIVWQGSLGNAPADAVIADLADMNGDGKADIVWRRTTTGEVFYWATDGYANTGTVSMGVVDPALWMLLAADDFNGDGKGDLLWRASTGEVYVWLMDCGTLISATSLGNPGGAWSIKSVGDLTHDGKADLVWRHTDGTTYLWTMDGGSVSSMAPVANPGGSWQIVAP
jgi:subtilisin family serine protease